MKMSLRIRRILAVLTVFFFAFAASANVYINEVLAENNSAFNNDGEFPDYIELYNTNTVAVNISGWFLSVNTSRLSDHEFTYRFPANTVVQPRSFLVIICDGNTNQLYHTRFNLSRNGEYLWLLGPNQSFRDAVRFGFQVQDRSCGRVPDGPPGVHMLCEPTPGDVNVSVPLGNRANIRFNEWSPSNGDDDDWFEIYNTDLNPVSLGGLVFSDRVNTGAGCTNKATMTNSWMAARGFLQFFCDDHAEQGHDQLDFKLTSQGEPLTLFQPNRTTIIHRVTWSGAGLLESYGWLPDGNTNDPVVTFAAGRTTPGDSNFLPIDNVVITEILAHSDPPLEDAIELHNLTASPVDIGGWWLSDDKDTHDKFRIPIGTVIPPNGYVVFYEYTGEPGGFNPNGLGEFPSFSLSSSQGDEVYLFATTNLAGKLNGQRRGVDFPPSPNGVSYGRYITSTGESDFVPMKSLTLGSNVTASDPTNRLDEFRAGQGGPNAEPLLGPLVISEIMYHPPDFVNGTNIVQNELDEYVEIYNASTETVYLYDRTVYPYPPFGFAYTNTWRLRGEVDFDFPTNVSLAPGQSLLVVNFPLTSTIQLNVFRAKYGIPFGVQLFGPYGGALSDGGAPVEIERPDAPQPPGRPDAGFVPYVRVDRVVYDDDAPWPLEADGVKLNPFAPNSLGYCLLRKKPELYGSDVANWFATVPSAGRHALVTNYVSQAGNAVTVSFDRLAGSSYRVEYMDGLESGAWQLLENVPPQGTTARHEIIANPPPGGKRFYRVITPMP